MPNKLLCEDMITGIADQYTTCTLKFTGTVCEGCGKTVNTIARHGFACVCGVYNVFSTKSFEVKPLHEYPDMGLSKKLIECIFYRSIPKVDLLKIYRKYMKPDQTIIAFKEEFFNLLQDVKILIDGQ